MNKIEYTREYLRDNFEFPAKKTDEELFWKHFNEWMTNYYKYIGFYDSE